MAGVGDALPGWVYPFVEGGISGSEERRQRCGSSPAAGGRIGPRPAARSAEVGGVQSGGSPHGLGTLRACSLRQDRALLCQRGVPIAPTALPTSSNGGHRKT